MLPSCNHMALYSQQYEALNCPEPRIAASMDDRSPLVRLTETVSFPALLARRRATGG
jgi:hypothetical protein